jgi:hypothetical protein
MTPSKLFLYPRRDLHDQWAQTEGGWFVEFGWGLPECSWHWGGWHSRRFLELVLWGTDFTWLLRLLESFLPSVVLSCRYSGRWSLSRGRWSPWAWTFVMVLTIREPVVLVLEAPRHGSREPGHVLSRVMRLGRNRHPSVPWVRDPESSPRVFCRVGGRSRLLNRKQNRYSHVTAGTVTGSNHDHGGVAVWLESWHATVVKIYGQSQDIPAL